MVEIVTSKTNLPARSSKTIFIDAWEYSPATSSDSDNKRGNHRDDIASRRPLTFPLRWVIVPSLVPSARQRHAHYALMTLGMVSSTAVHCSCAPASPRVVTLKMMPQPSPRQTVVIFSSSAWLHFRTHNALQDGCSAVDGHVVRSLHLKGKVRRWMSFVVVSWYLAYSNTEKNKKDVWWFYAIKIGFSVDLSV